MPELPEVETIVRDLRQRICGLNIINVKVHDGRVIRQVSENEFCRKLVGQRIASIIRRGKAIIIEFNDAKGFLVVQLMMTGQLIFSSQNSPEGATKVSFQLSNKCYLHYNDWRTFGRLLVVSNIDEIAYFKVLGPEPLEKDFTVSWLRQRLKQRKTPIKPLLLNHTFVAGIGNIYASEILFASRIDPRRPAMSLQEREIVLLHRTIRQILQAAILYRGTSINTYRDALGQKGKFINRVKVYGREHEQCHSCATQLVREFQSGRSTFYCPECQK